MPWAPTCSTDEHCAAQGNPCSATSMDAHWQGLDQGSLLKRHIIGQSAEEANTDYDLLSDNSKTQRAAAMLNGSLLSWICHMHNGILVRWL